MRRTHSHRSFAAALLAAAACAAAWAPGASAQQQLEASFTVSPEHPAPGETVTLNSTTTPPASSGRSYAWDLDNDGNFDDGGGDTVTTSFAATGDYVVRLRVRQAGPAGETDDATRTVEVRDPSDGEEQPPPEQDPAKDDGSSLQQGGDDGPGTTYTPNHKPNAAINSDCGLVGGSGLVFCEKLFARHRQPHTFDASTSSDEEGPIAKFEWDLDNDGTFELDTGKTAAVTRTYEYVTGGNNLRTVGLRVTDSHGETATTTQLISVLAPGCEKVVVSGRLTARGVCLKQDLDTGSKTIYRSKRPVSINGIVVVPRSGELTITLGDGNPRIQAAKADVSVKAKQATAKLSSGKIDWRVVGDELQGVSVDGTSDIGGLRITGLPTKPRLLKWGAAEVRLHAQLPETFTDGVTPPPTSDKPIVVKTFAAQAASSKALNFSVPNAFLGPIGLDKLTVTFDGIDLWTVEAGVSVPAPLDVGVSGGVAIKRGEFQSAWGEAEIRKPIFAAVWLQRVSFAVEVHPGEGNNPPSKCVEKVGWEEVDMKKLLADIGIHPDPWPADWVRYWYVDHGVPDFALCGGIELTAGPEFGGTSILSLDAKLGLATYPDRPFVVFAKGGLKLFGSQLAKAETEIYEDGYFKVRAVIDFEPIEDVVSLRGGISYEMWKTKFNAEAWVDACIEFLDACAGAEALLSSRGAAVCLRIGVLGFEWRPGAGWLWEDLPLFDPYFAGCDVGPYRAHIGGGKHIPPVSKTKPAEARAAQADVLKPGQTTAIDLPAGLPGATFYAKGATGAPNITLIGPNGERIETPPPGSKLERPGVFGYSYPKGKTTGFAVAKPSGGRWTVQVEDGSTVVELKSAEGLERPKVDGRVTGSGHKRTISYSLTPLKGQKVTFIERGPTAGKILGVAKGAKGKIRFSPANGKAEKRDIVAIVEQDGLVRDELRVATYTAPKPAQPGRIRKLKVRRRGSALAVSWKRSHGAKEHQVALSLRDGRRIVKRTKRTSLLIKGVGRRVHGTVSVRGMRFAGNEGRVARTTV